MLRALAAFAALNSVAPLLGWVYGTASFAAWCRYWTLPWLLLLIAIVVWTGHSGRHHRLHTDLCAGVLGGLLGTLLYDVVRLPFLLMGLRLLAPIDSYGVLLLDAAGSSPRTGLAGWLFHVTNGVCFGVAYAAVASRRHPGWGVAWAMVLESVAVFSPFALRFGLHHRWGLIAIAFAAHVPYGLAVGYASRNPERTIQRAREATHAPVLVALGVTVASLLVWQRPWSTPAAVRAGEGIAPGPSAVIRGRHLSPQWIRVPPDGCAVIRNDDAEMHLVQGVSLRPGVPEEVCFTQSGVHRVKLEGQPWTGGFVIVDPEAPRTGDR